MKTDIQIAQEAHLLPIREVAAALDLPDDALYVHGTYKAKVDHRLLARMADRPDGRVILVTAINPTPAGEGKTTVSVGLADSLQALGKKTLLTLREPSLGPVFGMKGGAAGGGYAQVVPMEDINLHFTGDLHAITAANNLLAALIDNHIHHGNALHIDPRRITWKRCLDMNDRQLRFLLDGLGGKANGTPREDGFDITVASEVMAILCLSQSLSELKTRLSRILVGYTYDNAPITAGDLQAQGAMAALLKDAFHPNLVQTLEHTPAFVHGGPFANIAHGCNSLIATRLAMKLADYVVTEAGFGADLGAEKFLDIKCRKSGIAPSAAVVVATVRALKHHGGCPKDQLSAPGMHYLEAGMQNLARHVENLRKWNLPVCVALNAFPTDCGQEQAFILQHCKTVLQVPCVLSEVFSKGSAGGTALARQVLDLIGTLPQINFTYACTATLAQKITALCKTVYGAQDVQFAKAAQKALTAFEENGFGNLPVCIAKTQYSFSDNPALRGAPRDFTMTLRDARLCAGAGFVVAIMGDILTMPGLPKQPAALRIDVDDDGKISGLF